VRPPFAALVVAILAACGGGGDDTPARDGTATTLGVVSTALPADLTEQARAALERDAYRRDARFREILEPGFTFRATRVPQAEIDLDLWSTGELFELGGQLFDLPFDEAVGFGGADLPPQGRVHRGRRGGPDARKCSDCHWRGGPAGAGDAADNAYFDGDGDTPASALARNPVALAGAGLVELLAREMSAELAAARDALIRRAADEGAPVRGEVTAKGVSFGTVEARPDGSVDLSGVTGVHPDLVVRPFGWKGSFATVRDAVEDALLVHHGMQSALLAATAPPERVGPFARPDPDGDGVVEEIAEGQVTALTLYVALQEVPQIAPPEDEMVLLFATGRGLFDTIGCATCHVPSLRLDSTRFALDSRDGGPTRQVDLSREGAEPRIATGSPEVFLWSDLRRHDMGPALAEARRDRGAGPRELLTRPLWGLARSRPYLHDGRAPTIEEAIFAHDGEAREARERYEALAEADRAAVRVFLTSLTRARRMVVP